jgi:hypothetical protein
MCAMRVAALCELILLVEAVCAGLSRAHPSIHGIIIGTTLTIIAVRLIGLINIYARVAVDGDFYKWSVSPALICSQSSHFIRLRGVTVCFFFLCYGAACLNEGNKLSDCECATLHYRLINAHLGCSAKLICLAWK